MTDIKPENIILTFENSDGKTISHLIEGAILMTPEDFNVAVTRLLPWTLFALKKERAKQNA